MPQKVFRITIEIEIHAVTCPGVWLCPNGNVSLRIHTLGSLAQTSELKPSFPVLYHEKCIFHRNFQCNRSLANLHQALLQEKIYIELIQWITKDTGNLLSTFESSLAEVLYPSSTKSAVSGVDIDLLMEPMCCFPGIIAPKIEVSTKTIIEEVVSKCKCKSCKCDINILNPKTLTSKNSSKRLPLLHQKPVCHSRNYHRSLVNKKLESNSSGKLQKPIFVTRHADENSLKHCTCGHFKTSPNISNPPSWESSLNASPTYDYCSENMQKPQHRITNVKEECNQKENKTHSSFFYCDINHYEGTCAVCSKYKKYFTDGELHALETNDDDNMPNLTLSAVDLLKKQHSNSEYHLKKQTKSSAKKIHDKLQHIFHDGKDGIFDSKNYKSVECSCNSSKKSDKSYNVFFYSTLEKFYKSLSEKAKQKMQYERNANDF